MSESEYSKLVKKGFTVSATPIASVKQTLTKTSKSSKSSSTSQNIGERERIIHHNHFLYLALHKALTDYAEEKMMKSSKCNS